MSGLAASDGVRVLIVEDEPLMAEAIPDGLRLDPFRREVQRDGRYVALTRKQSRCSRCSSPRTAAS
jgi:DNA-binding response OmpR family regulator